MGDSGFGGSVGELLGKCGDGSDGVGGGGEEEVVLGVGLLRC